MKKLHIYLTALLLSISFLFFGTEAFAWSKNADGTYVNPQGQLIERAVAKGIDVSYAQGQIDWNRVKATDTEFVMIRCGSGVNLPENDDSRWLYNATECERLGIPYGVYHYSKAVNEAEAADEAAHVLRLLQGRTISYPIYYDLESASIAHLSGAQLAANAKVFCETLQAYGYQTGIYANLTWFQTKLTDPWFAKQTKWIARWNSYCGYSGSYRIWQSSSSGVVDGINGPVDINFMIEDVPAKVSFTKAVSASHDKHTLTWEPIPGVSGYEIYCKKPGSSKYTRAAKVAADVTSYTIGKRTTGKEYSYKIRAYKWINGKVEFGAYSNVKKVKAVPGTVNLQSVKRSSKTKVTLRWKKVSGASGYKIYYSKKKGSGYKILKTITKGSTTSVKVDVKKGKKYYYKIRAYKNVNKKPVYGKYSSVKSCK